MRRTLQFLPVLIFIGLVIGLAVYFAGTLPILPEGVTPVAPFEISPVPLAGTPVVRYARVNPAILDVLDYGASNYGDFALDMPGEGIQSVGSYLPRTGNTQFELVAPTPLPTPLPYPTSPPLPLPALPDMIIPTVPAVSED